MEKHLLITDKARTAKRAAERLEPAAVRV